MLQGLSTNPTTKRDLSGYPSLLITSFGADAPDELLKQLFNAHAEVDAYGLIIMKKAGLPKPAEAIAILDMLRIRDDAWNMEDIDIRASRILGSIDHVWAD